MTAGLTVASAAGAATTAKAAPQAVVATSSQGGYVTGGGRHFRFIQTTAQVSPARTALQFAGIVLGGRQHIVDTLYLMVKAGGGPSSVIWSFNTPPPFTTGGSESLAKLSPSPGDMLRLSIYYNTSTKYIYFTAVDTTKGVSQTRSINFSHGPLEYYSAAEAAVFAFGYTAPLANDFKLWSFTNCHVTTYSGVKGTMLGPWTTSKIVALNSSGQVVMGPSVLFNNGADFNVLRR